MRLPIALCSTLVLASTLALGAALPARAGAQDGSSADTEARALFDAGRTAYDAGRFDSAFDSFQRAYELSERPVLLFNLGATAERLRRDQEALEFYQRYLEAIPDAENRAFVESRITFLQTSLAAAPPPVDAAAATAEAPPPQSGSVLDEWWFWTILGVVVVGAGVGIGVGVATAGSTTTTESPIVGNFGGQGGVAMALVSF